MSEVNANENDAVGDNAPGSGSEVSMSFVMHLEELRSRMIKCAIAVAVGFVVCYAFKEKVLEWLMQPLLQSLPAGQSQKLIYTSPAEAFFTYLKVSFIGGAMLSVPVMFYQLWRFIAPGLYSTEKRYVLPIVFLSTFFFVGGALFGYFFVFPTGFQFFTSFANEYIAPLITTKEYLSFILQLLLGFGVIFEMPIFVFFLAKLGLVSAQFLKKQRRYAIIIIFIIAAALTPGPDIFSQIMMATPMLVLYEVSVWIAYVFGRKKSEDAAAETALAKS
jgi:sec-independent protein translocase protein TatC